VRGAQGKGEGLLILKKVKENKVVLMPVLKAEGIAGTFLITPIDEPVNAPSTPVTQSKRRNNNLVFFLGNGEWTLFTES
jgi:hypothetical protein